MIYISIITYYCCSCIYSGGAIYFQITKRKYCPEYQEFFSSADDFLIFLTYELLSKNKNVHSFFFFCILFFSFFITTTFLHMFALLFLRYLLLTILWFQEWQCKIYLIWNSWQMESRYDFINAIYECHCLVYLIWMCCTDKGK